MSRGGGTHVSFVIQREDFIFRPLGSISGIRDGKKNMSNAKRRNARLHLQPPTVIDDAAAYRAQARDKCAREGHWWGEIKCHTCGQRSPRAVDTVPPSDLAVYHAENFCVRAR
jgi:hypothetical protein